MYVIKHVFYTHTYTQTIEVHTNTMTIQNVGKNME